MDRDSIRDPLNNGLEAEHEEERQNRGGKPQGSEKGEKNRGNPNDAIIHRLALNSLAVAIEEYEREDLHGVSRAKRVKAVNATWSLFKLAIDTLVGRTVDVEDPPTKVEALNLLQRLIFVVPNNLDDTSRRIAEDAITVLGALLPDQEPGGPPDRQPGGFVN